ncbi:hypothetical protein NEOLI_005205 [Neolecta irregularis DAH-3]|uniref:Uncharacterized protein n=1 Tax=Neolecta irregularis (strain DAH-3) TaxID=1198029 RepID=A0A1U7LMB4_NEOID|nr:hypothetical protein NEOLI_005205 [Neolecta irregularis DAH-3]|eukprot:OLL23806.1 hypothetical protein NEOLI_005205 [Neolecta irregularis DAH-3]
MLSSYLLCFIVVLRSFVLSAPVLSVRSQSATKWFTMTVESKDMTLQGLPLTYKVLETQALQVTLKSSNSLVLQLSNEMVVEKGTGQLGYIPRIDGEPSAIWMFWENIPEGATKDPFIIDENGYLTFGKKLSWFVCRPAGEEGFWAVKWGPAEYSGAEHCHKVFFKTTMIE